MKTEAVEIALVIPPSPFLADERVFPFLGVLKVASALEAREQRVHFLDLSGIENFGQVVQDYLENEGENTPRIGITATTPQFPQAVTIAEILHQYDRKAILGGAHATMVGSAHGLDQKRGLSNRGTKAFEQMTDIFETVVLGDGELAVFETLQDSAPKIIDAGWKDSPLFLKKGSLDNFPFPNRDLIDLASYHYEIDRVKAQSMIAQLGCPFECGFCSGRTSPSFRMTRTRSVESILDEVDVLARKYGYQGVMFYDDELNINPQTLAELTDGLIHYQERTGSPMRFRGFVKAELFTREQARAMYQAGFRVLLSGVESGDDGILATMKKHTTREINSRFVEICHEAGLKAKALMSIGHPGETRQTVKNSLEWVLTNKPDDVDWTIITEYPGSPYFDDSIPHPTDAGVWVYTEPRGKNVLFSQDVNFAKQAEYYKGIPGDYTSFVWTETLSPSDLVKLRDQCEAVSREALGLPTIQSVPARQFEHSMGQGRTLPSSILRSTQAPS